MYLISLFGKLLNLLIRSLGLGSGETLPGYLLLRFFPKALKNSTLLSGGSVIIVSGTNGKTSTVKAISHILRKRGFSVISNSSGANLKSGVTSSLLLGKPLNPYKKIDFVVLEVDELALPSVLDDVSADTLVLLNLSRDQLDRYGEVDFIVERWAEIINLGRVSTVIYDGEADYFSGIFAEGASGFVDFNRYHRDAVSSKLKDRIHEKNLMAVIAALSEKGIDPAESLNLLEDFKAAYGRGEVVYKDGVSYRIFLAKNPASMNVNLTFPGLGKADFEKVLFILNDGIPDGRDVSWIYDIESNLLNKFCAGKKVYISGSRCYDMAVRLDYAGVSVTKQDIDSSITDTVDKIKLEGSKNVVILPNYSAMLDFRKNVLGRKIL